MRELTLYLNKLQSEGKTGATIKNAGNFINEFLKVNDLDSSNISKITLSDIDNYMYELTKKGNSDNTRKTKVAYVRGFVKYLADRDILAKNIMSDVKVSAPTAEVDHIEISKVKEIINLAKQDYDSGKDIDSYPIILALFTSGLRIDCELMNITNKALSDDGITVVGKGKKERFVPLPENTIQVLRRHYEDTRSRLEIMTEEEYIIRQKTSSQKYIGTYKEYVANTQELIDKDYIFITELGTKRSNQTVFLKLKKYGKKVGCEQISAHKLRHSYAVNLLEQEVPMDVISKVLGHSDMGITSRIYAKTSNKRVKEALSNIKF